MTSLSVTRAPTDAPIQRTLRSSKARGTIRAGDVQVDIQMNYKPDKRDSSVKPKTDHSTVPQCEPDTRRRKMAELHRDLQPTSKDTLQTEVTDSGALEAAKMEYIPQKICKHLYRVAREEFKDETGPQSSSVLSNPMYAQRPSSGVQALLVCWRWEKQLEELLTSSVNYGYKDIVGAKAQDLSRMAIIARSIMGIEKEKDEAFALDVSSIDELVDVCQAILDSVHDEATQNNVRPFMSSLVRKTSGLPGSIFIFGVGVTRGHNTYGGTFGDIYKTSYQGKPVALKSLRVFGGSASERRKTCKSFYKEALLWQRLDHKNVLPFLGVDTENFPGRPCMVSPWMANGNAHDFVKNHPKLDVDKLLFPIAQGLEYLHSCPIVHGDIKGCNIMIDDHWNPRLADFGLTTWADVTKQDTTQHGGTVRWMAPELLNPDWYGLPDCKRTFATDVYAYGCLCLELHTRERPWAEIALEAVVSNKITGGERPCRPVSSQPFADDLWALVNACWLIDPDMRPKCADIVEVLKRTLRQSTLEGTAAPSPTSSHFSSPPFSPVAGVQGREDTPDEDLLQQMFDEALLRVRNHADPWRTYVHREKTKRSYSVQVLQARTALDMQVTIKRINIPRQNKAKIVQLISEFQALRWLQHPHVVGYIDAFRCADRLWVVQDDLSETITLKKVFRTRQNNPALREPFLLRILPSLLNALDYLHSHGVYHGQLGLEDVIFTKAAQTKLKLCAMIPDPDTIPRNRLAPPEVVEGHDYSQLSDIWNLGLLMIDALDPEKRIDLAQPVIQIIKTFKRVIKPTEHMYLLVTCCLKPLDARPSAAAILAS